MEKQAQRDELLTNGRGSVQASSVHLSVLKVCEDIPWPFSKCFHIYNLIWSSRQPYKLDKRVIDPTVGTNKEKLRDLPKVIKPGSGRTRISIQVSCLPQSSALFYYTHKWVKLFQAYRGKSTDLYIMWKHMQTLMQMKWKRQEGKHTWRLYTPRAREKPWGSMSLTEEETTETSMYTGS